MPLISAKAILDDANKNGYAVGAFNANNMEFLQAIFAAADSEKSPIIIAASEGAMKYAGAEMLYSMVKTLSDAYPRIPAALHLDHGSNIKAVMTAVKAGFTSVMIDASHFPYEENLKMTKQIVGICHPVGISVEAELGRLQGIEDNVSVAERDAVLVNPAEAHDFVESSGIDFLAPAIGTSHGAFKFKGEAKLDFERLKKVKELTGIPLVLHGASSVPEAASKRFEEFGGDLKGAKGVPFDVLKEAVKFGINKVNTDTDLRIAFLAKVRESVATDKSQIDPRKIFGPARDYVIEVIGERMKVLGSSGRI
ncbi:MAG: class II fructose-1,6-bisphosphate aldolase [Deltaproteobacteria bacterium]|jgi:fructose-bisphosphate aldolase class II|nr:class II fructose-1,6-bisphosphate aldolase [Deltaproteobacteria bacterium]